MRAMMMTKSSDGNRFQTNQTVVCVVRRPNIFTVIVANNSASFETNKHTNNHTNTSLPFINECIKENTTTKYHTNQRIRLKKLSLSTSHFTYLVADSPFFQCL
eukprot:GILK01024406.1.p1 GENE.GILK01024406.1~~GILK01024406.1.p1  ORF type:complete len:103 (+),score=3.54 GILK01024406.1:95-403(+)